jgi:hypothetical protein
MKQSLAILFGLLSFVGTARASVAVRLYINGNEAYTMPAGQPEEWIYEIYNPDSPEPFHHFHPMHGKEVHAFVISEDLSLFAHFHPAELGNMLGLFGIHVNQPNDDPDSQDAVTAVMTGGNYFLYVESMPMTEKMTISSMDLYASGNPRPQGPVVTATPVDSDGAAVVQGEDYRLSVTHEQLPHPGTYVVILHVHIEKFDPASGAFKPVTDLQPWLLAYAHSIMITVNGAKAADKRVLHGHSSYPIIDDPTSGQGPDVDIVAEWPTPPPEGLYKTWIQFQHQGKIHTIPLAIPVTKPVGP